MAAISEDHRVIGLKIANQRSQRGLAQADLAEELGISRNAVGAMERGEADFGISRMISVCDALNVTPAEIFPNRLAEKSRLPDEMQELEEKMSQMTPYQRSLCMRAIIGVADAFKNITQ